MFQTSPHASNINSETVLVLFINLALDIVFFLSKAMFLRAPCSMLEYHSHICNKTKYIIIGR